jgi:hypothetical protein
MSECRICMESEGVLVVPCKCKGTMAFIHRECLARLGNKKKCTICKCIFFETLKKENKIHMDIYRKRNKELEGIIRDIRGEIVMNRKRIKTLKGETKRRLVGPPLPQYYHPPDEKRSNGCVIC